MLILLIGTQITKILFIILIFYIAVEHELQSIVFQQKKIKITQKNWIIHQQKHDQKNVSEEL